MMNTRTRFRSLRWRINAILAAGIGIVAIGATLAVSYFLTDQLREGLEKKGWAIATLLGQNLGAAIEFDDNATADEMLQPLKTDSEFSYVYVVKLDGTVFSKIGDIPLSTQQQIRKKNAIDLLADNNLVTIYRPVLNQQKNKVGHFAIAFSMDEILTRSRKIRVVGIVSCVILISLLMLYFAFAMNRTVVKPIKQLIAFVQKIGEGDLRVATQPLEKGNRETLEIQLMREALSFTIDTLRENVNAIQLSAKEFSTIADNLFAASSDLSSVAKRQVDGVNDAFSTAKRMETTGEENASSALDISETAETSVEVSGHGRSVVKDTVDQFHSVREQVQTIVDAVEQLNSQLSQIDAIIQSVADVAKQSQLLAVNASIEAAKAGEAGLRFAVVSKEIKHLAVHSRDATDSVRKTLGNVKKGIRNIAEASEDGRKRVSRGMISIENSGKVINRLAAVIKNTAEAARQISDNTHQQVDGLKEMSAAMYQIDDLSKGNLGFVRKIENYGEKLNTKAQEMEILVSKFRLN
jgi:methyl-accepting chemotaxis protein